MLFEIFKNPLLLCHSEKEVPPSPKLIDPNSEKHSSSELTEDTSS